MKHNNPFILGTLILTITSLINRLIGFFYRIYLSRLFGEEGMGIYQLLSPVLALSFSLTAAGIQTAISKYVASEASKEDYSSSFRVLLTGSFLSILLSFPCTLVLLYGADSIAVNLLLEPRCASMLRIIAWSVPLSALHSCINGYFYGIKKTAIPAGTQLIEQIFRVLCVFIASYLADQTKAVPTINVAVLGLLIGELVATLISLIAIWHRFYRHISLKQLTLSSHTHTLSAISRMAFPLSGNRIILNFLQSVEAVCIPERLCAYGLSNSEALSIYGVFTGMALPMIFFPNALTGSVSVLLLPLVSEADATGNYKKVRQTISRTRNSCFLLGLVSTLAFLILGKPFGELLFHSKLAGQYIMGLSLVCPALYLSTTLSSVLHGLGKVASVFIVNLVSLVIRLLFVFLAIPFLGMPGYILGLMLSQLFTSVAYLCLLSHYVSPL